MTTKSTATADSTSEVEDLREDRRREIVEAARTCVLKWGFAKTTMDDIAQLVGIARPNLYRYFSSKEALASAVSADESRRINKIRRDQIPVEGPVGPLIEQSIILGLELAFEDEYLTDLLTRGNREAVVETISFQDVRYEYWQPIFDHGRDRGELRDDISDADLMRWLTSIQLHFLANRDLYNTTDLIARDVRMFVVPSMVT